MTYPTELNEMCAARPVAAMFSSPMAAAAAAVVVMAVLAVVVALGSPVSVTWLDYFASPVN